MSELGFDIDFFEPETGPTKATVHKTGKLGFTTAAIKMIDFENNRLFKIGKRKDDSGIEVLYMIPVSEKDDLTFDVVKSGDYYSIKAKRLLNQLNIDYENEEEATSFNVAEVKDGDRRYFKLTRAKKKKRPNNN